MLRPRQPESAAMVRRTVSLPADEFVELERIASERRVSVSWVVRDAVTQYLASRTPLFTGNATGKDQRQ